LDSLPFPARYLVRNELYRRPDMDVPQTTIVTSRGCPFKCVFCLSRVVAGTKPRTRAPENILEEIRECVERFGIRDFLFRSDTFTARRSWIMDFCKALRSSDLRIRWSCNSRVDTIDTEMLSAMKSAGCWLMAFGLESGSQEILDVIHKGISKDQIRNALKECRRAGIRSSVYFLLGLPWETEKTFQETVQFACEISPDFIEFFYTYPFEGTELYDVCIREGLLNPDELPSLAYSQPAYATGHFTLEQLAQQRPKALRTFYLRPGYILRTLSRARSLKILANYVRYGWKQLNYLMR
ncbi:MAG TPA: radical SAM protein, partial [bacterium]|nr:radical SAM protein [bacterium]